MRLPIFALVRQDRPGLCMTLTAIVIDTGLRNDDGSSRARVIRRRCAIGSEVVLRKGSSSLETAPAVAVYIEIPRLFGLLQARFVRGSRASMHPKKKTAHG